MEVRVLSDKKIKLSGIDIAVHINNTDIIYIITESVICVRKQGRGNNSHNSYFITTNKSHNHIEKLVSQKYEIKKKYIHTYVKYIDIKIKNESFEVGIPQMIHINMSESYLENWLIRYRDKKIHDLLC